MPGDQWIGFEVCFLPNQKLPPGYTVDGVFCEEGTFYHWTLTERKESDIWPGFITEEPVKFGVDRRDRFQARRDAWAHYNGDLSSEEV